MTGLFDEVAREVEIPDTLDLRIAWFLNRWHWRGPREAVEGELRALIDWALSPSVGEAPTGDAGRLDPERKTKEENS